MKLQECLSKVTSQTVLKKYATVIIENRNEKDHSQIKSELLEKIDTIRRRVNSNLDILEKDRIKRILKPIIMKILLEERNYRIKSKTLYEKVREYEEKIVKDSKRDYFGKKEPKAKDYDIYNTVLESAWLKDKDISVDEENLLRTLRNKMGITLEEHWMLQVKLGIFPKPFGEGEESNYHTSEEVTTVTKALQSDHILLLIIGEDKEKYYIVPEEIADVIKEKWGIQLSKKAYRSLLENKQLFNKEKYFHILNSAGIKIINTSNKELINTIIKNVQPKDALTTFVPTDKLTKELEKICLKISNKKGYSKNDRINRIFRTLDELSHKKPSFEDPREIYYHYLEQLATRNHKELRKLRVIEKDLDIEKAFEEGTRFLFEKKFNLKYEKMPGTDHADGKIKIDENTIILWDNKSKEKECKLKSHIDQFRRYIRNCPEKVITFVVIAPEFDSKSEQIAHIEKAKDDITFSLVKACDLKMIAEDWSKSKYNKNPFPLSIFNISGLVEYETLKNAFQLI